MTIVLFIVILGVLVLVHELGHFLAAKRAGVKVEEFGFGYPPRAATLGFWKGTRFSLNWIPFGGFVKIFGENYEEIAEPEKGSSPKVLGSQEDLLNQTFLEELSPAQEGDLKIKAPSPLGRGQGGGARFSDVSKKWQAAILAAGVFFNIVFAWLLFSTTFMIGMPTSKDNDMGLPVQNAELMVVSVIPDSPADKAGLKAGDKIEQVSRGSSVLPDITPENVSAFIGTSDKAVTIQILRGEEEKQIEVAPVAGLANDRKVIGITMDEVGILRLNPLRAVWEGLKTTVNLFYLTVTGILGLIFGAIAGTADLSQVTGPVGIVGLVGDASRLGLTYLLTFTALISINLAVVNLLPFPALDGGRLVFVAIEAITRKKIKPNLAQWVNMVGFAVLLILMALVTVKDIKNLF
jgi:regulator of sigma E protease